MKYTVYVDDNFNYQDEDERYILGNYDKYQEALAAAKKIVDDYLEQTFKPGMTAMELYEKYTDFGEDPFIVGEGPRSEFSAWNYAKDRCEEICSKGNPFEES